MPPMPRTGTVRVKSPRSSGPSPTPSNVSTPKFMPPSHYAAAGGYTPRQVTNKEAHAQSEHARSYRRTSAATSFTSKRIRNVASSADPSRMPIVVHAPSGSESSMVSNLEDHVPDLSEDGIKNGFPQLEAQLLPSLRDTIERMTGGPARISTQTTRTRTDGVRNGGSNTRLNRPGIAPSVSRAYGPVASASLTKQPYHYAIDTPTISHSYQSTPNPEISSRLKTPTKSALKSSLRSPSIKTPNATGSTPKLREIVHTPTPSPLKSMRTLLTRKCSGKLRSPFAGDKAGPDSKDSRNEYSSSHSQYVSDNPLSGRPPASKNGHQTNIPRPRIGFPDPSGNIFYSDDSDFEHRFEVESRDRRKLTVTNAEVFVSESSSEGDAALKDGNTLNGGMTGRTKYLDSSRTPPVGLGLNLLQKTHGECHISPNTRNEGNGRYLNPGKNLRFSLPPSNSGESTYSDEFGNYDASTVQRRQESCVPADIDIDFNHHHPTRFSFLRHRENIQEKGAAYFRSKSQSQSPDTASGDGSENKETESERDGYSIRRLRTDQRRRSSSCSPSFRATTLDTTHNIYDRPSPRPTSSRQRRGPEEYTPDREFPQSLKELIRHRNSSSKLSAHPNNLEPQVLPESTSRKRRSDELDSKRPSVNSRNASRVIDTSYNHSSEEHWANANSDSESFRSVATRERLAFGIPPSESEDVFSKDLREPGLSHADSDMSSINEYIWRQAQGYDDEVGVIADMQWRLRENENRKLMKASTPRLNVISPTLSSESMTVEDQEASAESSIGSGPYNTENHAGKPVALEVTPTREGVIQEIFETEEDLLHHLRICMRKFVIPLRVQDSRTWITGVPPTVARQLDWFDDIVHLHEQIYEALCAARDTMSPATDRVSESLRWFVLKIEVYQPYLVKLADAKIEIHGAREDQKCELGQFIRLQEMNRECRGWTLERFLMLPVNRLASYQDLFSRMLDLTPKIHQDYLSTLSLSRSTDIALKVMTEVKAREDEYNLLKEFSLRIQGLPTQNHLATRDRRLLHSGPLRLVISNLHELAGSSGTPPSPAESKRISRSSKLLDAIARSPPEFVKPAGGNCGSTNDNDEGSAISSSKLSWFSRLPLRRRSRAKSPLRAIPVTDENAHTGPSIDLRAVEVHAFVFNDLVLLVQQNRTHDSEHSWILSEDVGIFRPLSIARLKRRNAQEGMILSLEVATVDPLTLNDTFNFRSSSWSIVDLLLHPLPSPGTSDGQPDVNYQPWLNSLRQCCKNILRKLTFITYSNQGESSDLLGSDRLLDTHLVVSSLTASGLPIPRSPSGSLPETCTVGGDRVSGSSDEREERGWWSLRYQQVFRELQRQDSGLLDDEEED